MKSPHQVINRGRKTQILVVLLSVLFALVALPGNAAAAADHGTRQVEGAPKHGHRAGPDGASLHRLYYAYYGRLPDVSGLDYWAGRQVRGTSLDHISDQFARSNEFQRKYGSVDDTAFVDLVYRNVLGRSADQHGRQYWLRVLANGQTRGSVMRQFSDSSEFKSRTGMLVSGTRVALIGDSLMWEAGPSAVTMLESLGYEVDLIAHPGSGLLASFHPMDWHARMREVVEDFDPHLVVVEFCCNHWPGHQPAGHPYRDLVSRTPEFDRAWSNAVDESVRILTSRGAKVSWVTTPAAEHPDLNGLIGDLNRISARAAQRYGLGLIDWERELSPGGRFEFFVGGEQVRDFDGLHFAPAGARRAAEVTVAHVLTM